MSRIYHTSMRSFLIAAVLCIACLPGLAHAATLTSPPGNNLGLLAWWTMDGKDTSWATGKELDESGNGYNATFHNMATSTGGADGKLGQALFFNGSNQYLNIPAIPINATGAGGFSICSWAQISKSGTTYRSIWRSDSIGFGLYEQNDFVAYNGGELRSGVVPVVGQWYHVCMTAGDGVMKIYVNGQLKNTGTQAANTTATSKVGGDGFSQYFPGDLDDVRMYSRMLSDADVAALYAMGTNKRGANLQNLVPNGLVGYWPMDGKDLNWATGQVTDESGSGLTGQLTNFATTTGPTLGKIGQALRFVGTASYRSVVTPTYSIPSDISAGAWVYSSNFSQNGFIIEKAPVNTQWELFFEGGWLKWRGGNTAAIACSLPANNQWHYIMGTQTGTIAKLYIDGVLCSSGTVAAIANGTGSLWIGAYDQSNGYDFNGIIDDVRLYNRALSATEVAQLYGASTYQKISASPTTLLTSGLVGYWTMDGRDTNWKTGQEADESGNGNVGQLISMGTTTSPTMGKIGQALTFNQDSTWQYLMVGSAPVSSSLQVNSHSFAMWIYKTGGSGVIIGSYDDTGGGIEWGNTNNCGGGETNVSYAYTDSGGTIRGWYGSTYRIPTNQWVFLVGTWDNTNGVANVYANGVLQSTFTTVAGTVKYGSATQFEVGHNIINSGCRLDAKYDDVRFYNRVLSASEIKALYYAGK